MNWNNTEQSILKEVIQFLERQKSFIVIDQAWKKIPKFTGFTGSTVEEIEVDPPMNDEEIEYKQKKYQELINQIEASLDFAKGE